MDRASENEEARGGIYPGIEDPYYDGLSGGGPVSPYGEAPTAVSPATTYPGLNDYKSPSPGGGFPGGPTPGVVSPATTGPGAPGGYGGYPPYGYGGYGPYGPYGPGPGSYGAVYALWVILFIVVIIGGGYLLWRWGYLGPR